MTGGPLMNPFKFGPPFVGGAVIYTGDGNDDKVISGMDFKPDLLWNFHRTGTTRVRRFADSARGPTIYSNNVSASIEITDANGLQQFLADGFELGNAATGLNVNTETYGAWGFLAGVGAGLSIVLHTGTSSPHNIAHTLGATPEFIITRCRSASLASRVFHKDLNNSVTPQNYFLRLEHFDGKSQAQENWDNTAPDSVNFRVGEGDFTNDSGRTFVSYLFRGIPGKSFFGKYVGTEAEQLITGLGFQPSVLFIKIDSGGGGSNQSGWQCQDAARGSTKRIRWNTNGTEDTDSQAVKSFDSDGFTLGTSQNFNKDTDKYLFGAWK